MLKLGNPQRSLPTLPFCEGTVEMTTSKI